MSVGLAARTASTCTPASTPASRPAEDALAGLTAPQVAAPEALLRRARVRPVRAHHPAARVLPDPHGAADPHRPSPPASCAATASPTSSSWGRDRRARPRCCSTRCARRARCAATCPSTSARRRSSPRRDGCGASTRPSTCTASPGTSTTTSAGCPARTAHGRRLVAFLGGTIGNLEPEARVPFLRSVADLLGPEDILLVGTDLAGDPARIRSGLRRRRGRHGAVQPQRAARAQPRAGRRLRPGRLLPRGALRPRPALGRDAAALRARRRPCAWRPSTSRSSFARGEEMRTEISCKFTRAMVEAMYADAGLALAEWHEDPRGWFAVSLARPAG